jgi:hypothetical protein
MTGPCARSSPENRRGRLMAAMAPRAERGSRLRVPGTLFVEMDPKTRDALRITLDARGRLSVEILRSGQDGVVVTCTRPDAPARLAKALLNASKEN